MSELKDYVSSVEAAELLGVSRRRVLAMIKAGQVPAQRVGTGQRPMYMIARVDLDAVRDRKPGRPATKAPDQAAPASPAPKKRAKPKKGTQP